MVVTVSVTLGKSLNYAELNFLLWEMERSYPCHVYPASVACAPVWWTLHEGPVLLDDAH